MKIGAHEFAWVRWGAGGMANAKTRQAGVIQGLADQYHEPMAGEISPDMMFFGVCQKRSKLIADGCRSVCMGAIGHMNTGGRKSKTKRTQNGRAGHVLRCMIAAENKSKATGMVMAIREDEGDQCTGNKGCGAQDQCAYPPKKQQNKQRGKRK